MRPRFIIVNVAICVLLSAAGATGIFDSFFAADLSEKVMLGIIVLMTIIGLGFGFADHWDHAQHIALIIPMVGLMFTGLGFVNAVVGLTSLAPDALLVTMKNGAFALLANIIGIAGLGWITVAGWWAARVQV